MKEIEKEFIGKTFNDFLFRPQLGVAENRGSIGLQTRLSKNIPLNFPIVSANMDTVTASNMAIAIAQAGGIGIIHRNLTVAGQAEEVRKAKRAENFIIKNPYTLMPENTIAEATALMSQKRVGTVVIVDERGKLEGILTLRDIRFLGEESSGFQVENFMTSLRGGKLNFWKGKIETIEEAREILHQFRVKKLPLVEGLSFKLSGLITSKDIERLIEYPFANKDSLGRLRVGAAIGTIGDFLERAAALIEAGADILFMDIAHGHSLIMKKGIEEFKKKFGGFELVCGNIATKEGAIFLKELGVDGIKVGIGPGLGCRTRLETGAGVPQLQAIREVYCALEDEIPIIADGGITQYKDIWFALGIGANSVMLGSMLSGTDEAPGDILINPATGLKNKIYRGMTSPEAKIDISDSPEDRRTPSFIEGQERKMPYKGSIGEILQKIKESLQSSVSYAGEETLIKARSRLASDPLLYFIPLSEASKKESFER